jgi:hypothetical protein
MANTDLYVASLSHGSPTIYHVETITDAIMIN